MKRLLIILGIFGLLAGGVYAFFLRENREINVLVFSKTAEFRHTSIGAGQAAIRQLGEKHGFTVATSEDAAVFQEDELQKYNVIVFLNTTGDVLDDAQQLELNRFIQAGGGFVGIHAAADTEYEWPWYGELVGAYFESHPLDPNVREASLKVLDNTHASTAHLQAEWTRSDEWYNYKSISSNINVLVEVDESTYEGGTNGEHHPMVWYHDFDGGRSFYTGMGHTEESFSEPEFLQLLWGGIDYAAGPGVPVNFANARVAPEENRFSKVVLADNLFEPMELAVLPNRNLLFVERRGHIKMYDYAVDSIRTIAEMNVHTVHEDGLLGLALDPDYEKNNWIYLFYSPVGEKPVQHVSRFVFDGEKLDFESEKLLLTIDVQREECCHSAGSLEFGPNGNLFISVGDNTNPHESDGFSPSDERPDRSPFDAQKSSANMNDLRGKILRIKPESDGTYSIPDGNLFAKDGSEGRPEIYVMGCRNPFRISIDQRKAWVYWGDVGPDAGEPKEGRGPAGHDEVNQAQAPGFYGWPYFVGDNKPYSEYDFAAQKTLAAFNPAAPLNNSPNNTGGQKLPPAQPAMIYYPYGDSEEFPLVGDGGRNAMAGPVFYYDDFPETDKKFPKYYDGKFFSYDWMRGFIMANTLDEEGKLKRMEPFLPGMTFNNPVDIVMGPDGDMFLLEYGTNWFAQNSDARLVHLQFIAGNRTPVAEFSADKMVGAAPMQVQFTSESIDYDGDSLTYSWQFDEATTQSTEANPVFSFEKAGTYDVLLTIEDPSGETATFKQEIMVGNELADLSFDFNGNQTFYWDNSTVAYNIKVNDKEDGELGNGIDPSRVVVSIDYLERGADKNMIEMGHQAMVDASANLIGKQLMKNSDCSTCHQLNVASVGPTYEQIAEKYGEQTDAVEYLSNKIIKGGGGVWGEIAMAAHPQLSQGEARKMVQYILSLGENSTAPSSLPLKDTYVMKEHLGKGEEGSYIFSASYTDKGGDKIGPLTARKSYVLRHPKMQAESYSAFEDAMQFEVKPGMAPGVEEAFTIMIGTGVGSWIRYDQIDMTGVASIEIMASAIAQFTSGGFVEFRLDAPDGDLIGNLKVENSLIPSSDPKWLNLQATEGIHDLYLVFNAEGEVSKPICIVDWLTFHNQGATQ